MKNRIIIQSLRPRHRERALDVLAQAPINIRALDPRYAVYPHLVLNAPRYRGAQISNSTLTPVFDNPQYQIDFLGDVHFELETRADNKRVFEYNIYSRDMEIKIGSLLYSEKWETGNSCLFVNLPNVFRFSLLIHISKLLGPDGKPLFTEKH